MTEVAENGEVGRKELGDSEGSGPGEVGGARWRGVGLLPNRLWPPQESLPPSLLGRRGLKGILVLRGSKLKVTQLCPTIQSMEFSGPEYWAFPFSRGSSHSRNRIQVSHIAGGFFTS